MNEPSELDQVVVDLVENGLHVELGAWKPIDAIEHLGRDEVFALLTFLVRPFGLPCGDEFNDVSVSRLLALELSLFRFRLSMFLSERDQLGKQPLAAVIEGYGRTFELLEHPGTD